MYGRNLDRTFTNLVGVFVSSLVLSNILATKLWVIMGVIIPAGVITYPVTFLITDIIGEVYGQKQAQWAVWAGFICSLFALMFSYIATLLPPAAFFKHQEFFEIMFGQVGRITIASLCAYLVSQYCDVWLFHLIRDKTNGKHLWLRNNVATIISQLWDTIIFIVIAFYGIVPTTTLFPMIWGQWCFKIVMALCDTPFCYYFVMKYRGKFVRMHP